MMMAGTFMAIACSIYLFLYPRATIELQFSPTKRQKSSYAAAPARIEAWNVSFPLLIKKPGITFDIFSALKS